jgi:repressor LexA
VILDNLERRRKDFLKIRSKMLDLCGLICYSLNSCSTFSQCGCGVYAYPERQEYKHMTSEHTSDIQKKIFEFIVEYIRDEGMPPTNREIGSAMKIASTGHVDYHLSMLEKKGFITRESKKSRGIKLAQQLFGIRVMGNIAAGEPLDILTDPAESLEVGRDLEQQGAYALMVKGQSMIEDHICDKDYVVIKPQATCENGDIVVAVHLQGSGQATLKRFFQEKERDRVRLQPANSEMDPIYVTKSEWDREWQVQGKVIAIFRKCPAA